MGNGQSPPSRRLLRWTALDVIARCPPARPCATCNLEPDCRGRAKQADGFVSVEDLVVHRQRVGRAQWESEMLCLRPTARGRVYPQFEAEVGGRHVRPASAPPSGGGSVLVGGIDFGMRRFVMLWARVTPAAGAPITDARVEVLDEYSAESTTLDEHVDTIRGRGWGELAWVGVDPAGEARNSHSGVSDVDMMRRRGYDVRTTRAATSVGVDRVRARLDHGTLSIDPRCRQLMGALSAYHFSRDPRDPRPVKDGPDHYCDALRYLLVNLDLGSAPVSVREY